MKRLQWYKRGAAYNHYAEVTGFVYEETDNLG